MKHWLFAALITALLPGAVMADQQVSLLDFADLRGWEDDDHDAALEAFLNSCGDLRDPEWGGICNLARTRPDAKDFFETLFRPVLIEDGADMLFTGYYEPEIAGSQYRWGRYQHPIYAVPDDLPSSGPWLTRREIEQGALAGRGLELAYLADPVELFFLQVQGSGRIRLPNGEMMRVGFGAANRHEYSSLGMTLVRRGAFELHEASAQRIRQWVAENPVAGRDAMWQNRSYVFFREVSDVPADRGPLGAMNRSVTTLRSIAVDPRFVTLGAPVWIEKDGLEPMDRLMIAQDTGSAIKGAQRADIFYGTGVLAGLEAGQIRDGGRMVVLMPIQLAYDMLPDVLAQGPE